MKTKKQKTNKKTNSKTSSVGIRQYEKKSDVRSQYLRGDIDRSDYRNISKQIKKENKDD